MTGRPPPRPAHRGASLARRLAAGLLVGLLTGVGASACSTSIQTPAGNSAGQAGSPSGQGAPAQTPPTANVYAATRALSGAATGAKSLVYVPNQKASSVDVIDPATATVVRRFAVAASPEHVVPSWDLKTLWVNSDRGGMLTPIDPRTGKEGKPVAVEDPYNLYFTPDGAHALVMAERLRRIDVRDPHTMALQRSLRVPCAGVNHADYTADGSKLLLSCEFDGKLLVVDRDATRVEKVLDLNSVATPGATSPRDAHLHGGPKSGLAPGASAMPQDVRLAPDGRHFVVADMLRNGVWIIDATTLTRSGFLHTGLGAHGIYPSRDATHLYVSNRDEGTISVLDAATLRQSALWRIPGGGSPDMGGVSVDGRQLWLSGRFNHVVYVFDTTTGALVHKIQVGASPHGLCVWPQPGRYSLGHTGNMR